MTDLGPSPNGPNSDLNFPLPRFEPINVCRWTTYGKDDLIQSTMQIDTTFDFRSSVNSICVIFIIFVNNIFIFICVIFGVRLNCLCA